MTRKMYKRDKEKGLPIDLPVNYYPDDDDTVSQPGNKIDFYPYYPGLEVDGVRCCWNSSIWTDKA